MRRETFTCLLCLAIISAAEVSLAEAPRPNVVFLLADDLGRADCGFMGGTDIPTPHLDKLAAAGTILDDFYAQPVCSPTRAALMTGRYPIRYGLQVGVVRPWAKYGLALEERTLAQALHDAGYATAIVGKWHLGHVSREYLPTNRGFDYQYGHYNGALDYFTHERDGGHDWHENDKANYDKGYSTDLLARAACAFVKKHAGQKPFFLYVPFNAVHSPLQAPRDKIAQFENLKEPRRTYAAMVSSMDDAVGEIVAAVESAGVRDKTLFVFVGDNGGFRPNKVTDNGKYRAGKHTLYEGGVRVVAFASWDGHLPAGAINTEPMHIVDWYPTLIKLGDGSLDQPLPLDGKDIWPTLTENKPSPHEAILLNSTPLTGGVRVGKWKLIVRDGEDDSDGGPPRRANGPAVELFNLKNDPYEKQNLAGKRPEKVAELKARLDHFANAAVPPKASPKAADFQVPKIWGE